MLEKKKFQVIIITVLQRKLNIFKKAPKSQASIYQKGFGMTFCNPGPISYAW